MKTIFIFVLLSLGACAVAPQQPPDALPAFPADLTAMAPSSAGSIYSPSAALILFEDVRARRIGDVITVVLSERTDASKSASTSTDRSSAFELGAGTLFGRDNSASALESSQDFSGNGASVQKNSLTGSVTVTVVGVLPNGLLAIQGEKWLTLNQGHEYIRIAGHVRSQDVASDNTVLSTQVANARIGYSGNGALHSANREGWLTRFFGSLLSPL